MNKLHPDAMYTVSIPSAILVYKGQLRQRAAVRPQVSELRRGRGRSRSATPVRMTYPRTPCPSWALQSYTQNVDVCTQSVVQYRLALRNDAECTWTVPRFLYPVNRAVDSLRSWGWQDRRKVAGAERRLQHAAE